MANEKNIHVVPHKDGWATKTEGATRAGKVTRTQKEAIQVARESAQRNGVELVIHNSQGRIRAKDSHGKDDYPPKG